MIMKMLVCWLVGVVGVVGWGEGPVGRGMVLVMKTVCVEVLGLVLEGVVRPMKVGKGWVDILCGFWLGAMEVGVLLERDGDGGCGAKETRAKLRCGR